MLINVMAEKSTLRMLNFLDFLRYTIDDCFLCSLSLSKPAFETLKGYNPGTCLASFSQIRNTRFSIRERLVKNEAQRVKILRNS